MIIGLIITVLLGIFSSILGLIPSFTPFDPNIAHHDAGTGFTGLLDEWLDTLGQMLALFDLFIPVDAVFGVMFAIFAAKFFVVIVQLLQWMWAALPGKGT